MKKLSAPFIAGVFAFCGYLVPTHALAEPVVGGSCGESQASSCSIYSGTNLAPNTKPEGDPLSARKSFVGRLASLSSDGLESAFAADPKATSFGLFVDPATAKGAALLTGAASKNFLTNVGCGSGDEGGTCTGRFDTTGKPDGAWWETAVGFTLNFLQGGVSAFGFYATDVGDFFAGLSLTLTDTEGKNSEIVVVPTPPAGASAPTGKQSLSDPLVPNGSLLFFGFADTSRTFTSIKFNITQQPGSTSDDYLGFDDFSFGPLRTIQPPGVPEPATLALVAASLAALGATRRRRPR